MPIVYPTSDIIVSGEAVSDSGGTLSIASSDTLVIADDIDLVSLNGTAIDFDLQILSIYLDGDIAARFNGIRLDLVDATDAVAFDYAVSIGETGSIVSDNYGLYLGSNSHQSVRIGDIAVVNAGQITSFETAPVFMFYADVASFSNSGSVVSFSTYSGVSNAVTFYDITNAFFDNTGTLESAQSRVIESRDFATVSFMRGTDNVDGSNAGLITGGALALYSDATTSEIFVNTGVIEGNVQMSTIGGSFVNSGSIVGNIDLQDGHDLFDGRGGTVIGDVMGGAGDDEYIVDTSDISLIELAAGGTDLVKFTVNFTLADNFENLTLIGSNDVHATGNSANNVINGNSGDNALRGRDGIDILNGSAGNDILRGGRGNDTANGGSGDDTVFGGVGLDKLFGNDGNDMLRGGRGNDTVNGGSGDDTVLGGVGNDKLMGDGGDDILIGGVGKDILTGGTDSDQFVFSRASHSPNTANADVIKDFELGIDLINLSGLIADNLDYIGGAGFSGTGPEVRALDNAGSTKIWVDVDGDGVADMKIVLNGVTGILESDFML